MRVGSLDLVVIGGSEVCRPFARLQVFGIFRLGSKFDMAVEKTVIAAAVMGRQNGDGKRELSATADRAVEVFTIDIGNEPDSRPFGGIRKSSLTGRTNGYQGAWFLFGVGVAKKFYGIRAVLVVNEINKATVVRVERRIVGGTPPHVCRLEIWHEPIAARRLFRVFGVAEITNCRVDAGMPHATEERSRHAVVVVGRVQEYRGRDLLQVGRTLGSVRARQHGVDSPDGQNGKQPENRQNNKQLDQSECRTIRFP